METRIISEGIVQIAVTTSELTPGSVAVLDELNDVATKYITEGYRKFVLDLSAVDHIDSFGLARLLRIIRPLYNQSGEATIVATGSVGRVFEVAGFSQLMKVFPTFESARDYMQSRPPDNRDETAGK
jgi:anti-anti-sigma factor